VNESRELPTSVIKRLMPSGPETKITVVPVKATVTAVLLIEPPPEFFGTRNRIEPLSTFAVRPALLKLKIVLAPRRVMVRSPKVSSDRDSSPVRTPVSSDTLSLISASRGSAWDGRIFTSRMIWVTCASFDSAPSAAEAEMHTATITRVPERILETNFMGESRYGRRPRMEVSQSIVERKARIGP
jgi:hypothetical protein